MILYHFTPLRTLFGENLQPGDEHELVITELEPSANDYPEMPPAVWLTTDPNPGGPVERCCFARVKLAIPSTDRRLISYKAFTRTLLRRCHPDISDSEIEAMQRRLPHPGMISHWWAYQGAIPLARWKGIELVRDQQVFWGALGGYRVGLGSMEPTV